MSGDEIRRLAEEGHLFRGENMEEALDRTLRDLLKQPFESRRPLAAEGDYRGSLLNLAYVTTDKQKVSDLRRTVRIAVEAAVGKASDKNTR